MKSYPELVQIIRHLEAERDCFKHGLSCFAINPDKWWDLFKGKYLDVTSLKPIEYNHHQLRIPIPKGLKLKLVRERGGICQSCSEELYHQIHHIDGDPSNNDESNLLLVCYECHQSLDRK